MGTGRSVAVSIKQASQDAWGKEGPEIIFQASCSGAGDL